MKINIVPADWRFSESDLERIIGCANEGLGFVPVEFNVLAPRKVHGASGMGRVDANKYFEFLQDRRYRKGTVAIVSRTLYDGSRTKEFVQGLSWADERYAVAGPNHLYGVQRHLGLAQTLVHEILHWGKIMHHRKRVYAGDKLCVMMPNGGPGYTSLGPCSRCQSRFVQYLNAA